MRRFNWYSEVINWDFSDDLMTFSKLGIAYSYKKEIEHEERAQREDFFLKFKSKLFRVYTLFIHQIYK